MSIPKKNLYEEERIDNNVYLVDPYSQITLELKRPKRSERMRELVKDIADEIYNVSYPCDGYVREESVMAVANWIGDLIEGKRGVWEDDKKLIAAQDTISLLKVERDAHKKAFEDMVADKMGKVLKDNIDKRLANLEAREKELTLGEVALKERENILQVQESLIKFKINTANDEVKKATEEKDKVQTEALKQKSIMEDEIHQHKHYVDKLKLTVKALDNLVERYGELDQGLDKLVDGLMLEHFEEGL